MCKKSSLLGGFFAIKILVQKMSVFYFFSEHTLTYFFKITPCPTHGLMKEKGFIQSRFKMPVRLFLGKHQKFVHGMSFLDQVDYIPIGHWTSLKHSLPFQAN
jgi:hypothetical protein